MKGGVLLLGAGGLLGRALQVPRRGVELTARTREQLDVTDSGAVERAIRELRPHWVVNASAYTNVDGAEQHVETAFAVNATAVGELARLCRASGCGLLHFSTDYVFDGTKDGFYTEDDACNPLSVYGASKFAGEGLVRASGARYLIVRTQWLYGGGGKSFVSSLAQRARDGVPTRAADDQFGGCTYVADLARASWDALDAGLEGTYHIANRGRVNRFMIAQRIFAEFRVLDRLTACRSSEFPAPAMRPANSPLAVGKIEHALGYRMPTWEDALRRYLLAAKPETVPVR